MKPSTHVRESASRAPEPTYPPLESIGLSASYDDHNSFSLERVDLVVEEGELTAVLGANGSGKSTLLRVLSGALSPSQGQVRLLGEPLRHYSQRDVARVMAVVGQSEEVPLGYSVREVVMMGRAPHQGGWMKPTEEDQLIVRSALERCDLRSLESRPVATLSGGEQKRVAIARALAQKPRVLLLDEPTAFFDVRHQLELYELLTEEIHRNGLTCLVVMHDLNIAAQYADRVALLKRGRVLAVGGVEDVMTYAKLRETFDADLYVGQNEINGKRFFLPMRKR